MNTIETTLRETPVPKTERPNLSSKKFDPTRIFVDRDRLAWFWFIVAGLILVAAAVDRFFLVQTFKQRERVVIRWNKKTYVIELVESPSPFYSVIFQYDIDADIRPASARVTPSRLLALLDKAKAYPLLKEYHANAVDQVEYVNFSRNPRVLDYRDYEVQLDEVFRFNPEDTLIFRILLRNKTDQSIQYRPDGFSLRVGERTYPQSISDASGIIPPKGEAPAYFAVTGTPSRLVTTETNDPSPTIMPRLSHRISP
jgi:hypothetical protein